MRPHPRQLETLTVSAVFVGILLGVSGIVLWLGDTFGPVHWLRPWALISGTFTAMVFVGFACWQTPCPRWQRVIYIGFAVLFLGTVIDSLDSTPDLFPVITLLLSIWAGIFALSVQSLVRASSLPTWQRRTRIGIGLLAIVIYGGTAGYYLVRNRLYGPVTLNHHTLYAFGIVINQLLRYVQKPSAVPSHVPPVTSETESR